MCFNSCVDNLFGRDLTREEVSCADNCVLKFTNVNQRLLKVYVGVQSDINQRRLAEVETQQAKMVAEPMEQSNVHKVDIILRKLVSKKITVLAKIRKEYVSLTFAKSLIFDPARLPLISILILAAELVLNVFVVQNVRYTEIDWKAYMQECEGFLNGTTDYSQLRGLS